ncbi:MAG: hypothetical protein M3220_23015 [Chloroflexota bacterium]|nr:hypothetical protein [Chloroflexota bacterium]
MPQYGGREGVGVEVKGKGQGRVAGQAGDVRRGVFPIWTEVDRLCGACEGRLARPDDWLCDSCRERLEGTWRHAVSVGTWG